MKRLFLIIAVILFSTSWAVHQKQLPPEGIFLVVPEGGGEARMFDARKGDFVKKGKELSIITDDGIYTVMADRFYYSSPTPWGYFKQFWSDPVSDINGITVT